MKLSTAIERYVDHHRQNGSSPRTIKTVRWRLNRLALFAGDVPVKKVSKSTLIDYFEHLIDTGLADGTLANRKATIRAFFRWSKKRGLVKKNPAKVLNSKRFNFSYSPVNFRPAPPDDFQKVIDHLSAYIAAGGYSAKAVRDAVIVSISIDSGARRGEIRILRRADIVRALETERGVYHVQSRGKTGAATLRFFDDTAALLRLWLNMLPDTAVWLFENKTRKTPLTVSYLTSAFDRVCTSAGVPVFRFQAVRKRMIIDTIRLSGDPKVAQILAGHSDVKTTQRHYNLVENDAVDDTAVRLSRQRRGNGDGLVRGLFGK